jgi:hypothetical protein
MDEHSEQSDYVWHFRLTEPLRSGEDVDAMTEMVRDQVEALLRCLTFTDGGRNVRVTGFRFLNGGGDVRLRSSLSEGTPGGWEDGYDDSSPTGAAG